MAVQTAGSKNQIPIKSDLGDKLHEAYSFLLFGAFAISMADYGR